MFTHKWMSMNTRSYWIETCLHSTPADNMVIEKRVGKIEASMVNIGAGIPNCPTHHSCFFSTENVFRSIFFEW